MSNLVTGLRRALGTNENSCLNCGDIYNQMADEGHHCKMTIEERDLLDSIAARIYTLGIGSQDFIPGIKNLTEVATAYLRIRQGARPL